MCMEQTTKRHDVENSPCPFILRTFAIYNTKVRCLLFEKKQIQQKLQHQKVTTAFKTALVAIIFGQ